MSKKLKILIALLLAATAMVAIVHRNAQEDIDCMVIRQAGREVSVSFEDLHQREFSGKVVNGKGEVSERTYTGISLKELLASKNVTVASEAVVTVTSADQYSVTFTAEEILAEGIVYAAVIADGKAIEGIDPGTDGVQIIIFGDPDSRRCVRYASIIEVAP